MGTEIPGEKNLLKQGVRELEEKRRRKVRAKELKRGGGIREDLREAAWQAHPGLQTLSRQADTQHLSLVRDSLGDLPCHTSGSAI